MSRGVGRGRLGEERARGRGAGSRVVGAGSVPPDPAHPGHRRGLWQPHIALLPIFPLLGAAVVLLLPGEPGPLQGEARVAACVYATSTPASPRWRPSVRDSPWPAEPDVSPVALDRIRFSDQ